MSGFCLDTVALASKPSKLVVASGDSCQKDLSALLTFAHHQWCHIQSLCLEMKPTTSFRLEKKPTTTSYTRHSLCDLVLSYERDR